MLKNTLSLLLFCLFLLPIHGISYGQDSTAFNPTTVVVEAKGGGGVPVGTIVAWPVATNPSDWDNWLECNGQAVDASVYPELRRIVGANVPDLRGRVLQERDATHVVGTQIEAGLPNIEGKIGHGYVPTQGAYGIAQYGALSCGYVISYPGIIEGVTNTNWYSQTIFNASYSNAIYGKSNTVQPPAYAVKFLIRALP